MTRLPGPRPARAGAPRRPAAAGDLLARRDRGRRDPRGGLRARPRPEPRRSWRSSPSPGWPSCPSAPRCRSRAWLGLALGGAAAPWLASRLSVGPGRRLVSLRADLAARLVDGVQGQADLLAFGREARFAAALGESSRRVLRRAAAPRRAPRPSGARSPASAPTSPRSACSPSRSPPSARARSTACSLAVAALVALASFEASLPSPRRGRRWDRPSRRRAGSSR